MTRPDQKKEERWWLDALLPILGITPDDIDGRGEKPDFILMYSGSAIGVEMTAYRPRNTTRLSRRQIEAEWDVLRQACRDFQAAQPDIRNVNVRFMFKNVVPRPSEHNHLIEEVAAFIRGHTNEIGSKMRGFPALQFTTSPLMKKYLSLLYLRTSEFAEWDSNVTAGWVARPDSTLADIVANKAASTKDKDYRPTTELWLVIHFGYRISETVIVVDGIDDLNAVGDLTNELRNGPFSRVYLMTNYYGAFGWDRSVGWRNLMSDPSRQKRSAFDEEAKIR
jgi:hypothetical protein